MKRAYSSPLEYTPMKRLLPLMLLGLLPLLHFGQSEHIHTLPYHDSIGSPQTNLDVLHWLPGHWRGEAFGGITEEVWTPALGGSMMCVFKLVTAGSVQFYETVTITEEYETLIMRLKHFHADLKGWEEKDKTVDFKLVKVTEDAVYFDGFTFERINNNEIDIYVVLKNNDKTEEVKFHYEKVHSP